MTATAVPLFDYSDDLQAELDAETLEAHGIPCLVRHEYETFNPAFTLKASLNAVHLLVDPTVADDARRILRPQGDDEPGLSLEALLATWSDADLLEVARRPDEWHDATVETAVHVLARRGVTFSASAWGENDARRVAELHRARSGDRWWMAVGFVLALAGLGGILMGLGYRFLTEIDPHGARYPVYDRRTRQRGSLMLLIGVLSATLQVWFGVFR